MVEAHIDNSRKLLVLTPNKSMSWETNKKILLAMFVVNMLIGIAFAMRGAWLILPFAGLEILLVGAGMYYVSWKLNFQETIAIEDESLQVQKGVYYPKESWQWQTRNTLLLKQPGQYRLSPPTLFLKHLNETVEIGGFLCGSDKRTLRDHLNQLGIPTHTVTSAK
ncbi:MAG: DUF2244 domain-containing protein [Gammaproteobacteria bacterium]|nr:DUF2244 domain-containing protein [Gammaproteobacteria bacterium]